MKTDNAMHKMSITAPTAVKEAINMVSSDPSSGMELVVELSVIVVLIVSFSSCQRNLIKTF